ncbi:MAG: hypothetical protein H6772_01865 [Pseudomonadales bacterium]|nr:hypothetical protein [Pseudomonadales bacterium]
MSKIHEVVIHQDVLEEDMRDMRARGDDVQEYEIVLKRLKHKEPAVRIPYEVSPQQLADMFEAGDSVTLSGCYGGARECIEEYGDALRNKGINVYLDREAILE